MLWKAVILEKWEKNDRYSFLRLMTGKFPSHCATRGKPGKLAITLSWVEKMWGVFRDQSTYSFWGRVLEKRLLHRERMPEIFTRSLLEYRAKCEKTTQGWGENYWKGLVRRRHQDHTGLELLLIPTIQSGKNS